MATIDVDFYPIYTKAGQLFAFYANIATPESDLSFDRWVLNLVHCDTFIVVYPNIGTLQQDVIPNTGGTFRFYSEFTFPDGVPDGQYRLIVHDEYDDQVKFISNIINVRVNQPNDLIRIKFRNAKNVLNYGYERIASDFYNDYRVKLVSRAPNFPVISKGYDLIDGAFNRVRSTAGETKEFVTTHYNGDDHQAFNAATIHSDFQVFEQGKFYQYKRGDQEYTIEWPDVYPEYPLADGRITLQKDSQYNSVKNV